MVADNVGINQPKPEARLDVNGNTRLRGDLSVEKRLIANGALFVQGEVTADNVWVKIIDQGFWTDQDFTMTVDGQTYRRLRIEVEGFIQVRGGDTTIGLRPNNATGNYGPGSRHWQGHNPNVDFSHGVGGIADVNMLPLCTTHWGQDGYLMCTGEMNTQVGMARMMLSSSIFYTLGKCDGRNSAPSYIISDIVINSWRNTDAPINSLTITFNGGIFKGRMILYGKK